MQDLMAHQKVWPHIRFSLREKNRPVRHSEATVSALWDKLVCMIFSHQIVSAALVSVSGPKLSARLENAALIL